MQCVYGFEKGAKVILPFCGMHDWYQWCASQYSYTFVDDSCLPVIRSATFGTFLIIHSQLMCLARLLMCVCGWPDAHQLHSCTVFLVVGQAGSLTSHNCWYTNMFTISSSTSPWQHPTTTRHDVVAMHGYYHHATISQVHCISSLHLSAHRPPTSWCVGRMYWWWPSLSLF